jgi:hypothetical protein
MSAWHIDSVSSVAPTGNKFLLLALSLAVAACTTGNGRDAPRQYLDPQTAATISIVDQPLVFARDRSAFAANVRDYVTVAAVAVNRSGKISYFLMTYFWSTVDTRAANSQSLTGKAPLLLADDRQIALQTSGLIAHDVGIGYALHHPNGVASSEVVATVNLVTLRYLSLAHRLTIRFNDDAADEPYELWNDQRAALTAFVRQLGGSP